jgi:3-dehydroquinate synthase
MALYFGDKAFKEFNQLLQRQDYSKLFILCDENTHEDCLPTFLQQFPTLPPLEILEVEPGEESKSLLVLEQLWHSLSELEADRHSLILNLGGGVISDLGGFMASTYMRGIPFVNFPTSLLAMVDASIGSKTGINFGSFKNRIGAFADAQLVGIVPEFLETLSDDELLSGWAEMLKHGLIASPAHFNDIKALDNCRPLPSLAQIQASVAIKEQIVKVDPLEWGERKKLNFGHTFGHALESYSHLHQIPLSHGRCVALGMMVALDISVKQCKFPSAEAKDIQDFLAQAYQWPNFNLERDILCKLILGDKKNRGDIINMVLLKAPGKAEYNCKVNFETIWDSYKRLVNGTH